MNHSLASTTAEPVEPTIRPGLGQRMRTVRVKPDMCLSVIKLDPSPTPARPFPTEPIQSIAGVYGVCVDGQQTILQILFDGRPETELQFVQHLQEVNALG